MPGCECEIVPIVLRNSGDIESTMVAEVSVSAHGEPKVHRVVVAIDSGHVVNPDTCRAQAKSCVVFGLGGAVLKRENSLKNGCIVESNFHDFPLLTVAGMPVDLPCVKRSLAPPESGCARCH
jgi:isoquinoline 1-oxidoreductase beta subunit